MIKKSVVAAAMACLLTGPALAEGGGEAVDYTPLSNAPESVVLDGLSLRGVALKTIRLRNGQQQGQEKLSFEPEILAWVREAMDKMGFRLTGSNADPLFVLRLRCSDNWCGVESGIRRETYLLRVEGGRRYFLKIPDRTVADYASSAGSKLTNVEAAQREAAFSAMRAALQAMATHVAEANSPEALEKQTRLFESAVPPRAASKAAGKKSAAR